MRTLKLNLLPPIALLSAMLPSLAFGQYYSPFRFEEGPGIKLTDGLVLHPGVNIEGRYDTNVLLADNSQTTAPYMRLVGHLQLATLSPQHLVDPATGRISKQPIQFKLTAAAGYREYFSGDQAVVNQRAVDVDAGTQLKLWEGRTLAVDFGSNYIRTVSAQNRIIGVNVDSATISRNLNRSWLDLILTPGGGRLELLAGYGLNLDAFENTGLSGNNKIVNEAHAEAKWRWLPKTAITLEYIQQFADYLSDRSINVNSKPMHLLAGLTGLVTPILAVTVKGGYGNSLHNSGPSYSNFLAVAEAAFRFMQQSELKLGYRREFDDSYFGNFMYDDRAFVDYRHVFLERLIVKLGADYRYRRFEGFQAVGIPNPDVSVAAHMIDGFLELNYRFTPWLYAGGAYEIQFQNLDTSAVASVTRDQIGSTDFTRHQIVAKLGISY
jgi:hypothetical protein